MRKLLIPIRIEAVIENKFNEDEKRVGQVLPEFNKLSKTALGDRMERAPFSRANPLEAGIHLHFILPDALTHGIETKDGFQYPDIPNHWLVTRIVKSIDDENPCIKRTCWMIESDYIGTNHNSGAPMPALNDKNQPYRFLGRCYPLGSPLPAETYLEHLNVFGAGDATFASFYPSCRSVLGFHDDLTQVTNGMLSYSVTGWYTDSTNDPLHRANRENWTTLMDGYGWECKLTLGEVPQNVLCQGFVYGLEWKGDSYLYPSGVPIAPIDITIGNTSQEALSALIAHKVGQCSGINTDMETFLNALQYDILDLIKEPDGDAKIRDEIHKRTFTCEKALPLWRLTGKSADIPKLAKTLLLTLNEAQKICNMYIEKKKGFYAELFYTWHTYLTKYENPPPPRRDKEPFRQDIYDRFELICERIDIEERALSEALQIKEKARQTLEQYICTEKLACILENCADNDYTMPNAPVFLFSGDGLKRSFLFGEDAKLQCRMSDESIREITIPILNKEVSLSALDLTTYFDALPHAELLPDCYDALFLEAMLLDCHSACFLAIAACRKIMYPYNRTELDRLAEQVRILSFKGQMPAKRAINFWTPPFHTLFLEWEVTYLPTKTTMDPDNSMNGWHLSGSDYQYEKEFPVQSFAPSFSGRTVVTPHSQYILKDALRKQIERYKGEPDILERLEKIAGFLESLALLSQNLGGFTEQLISLRPSLHFPFMLTNQNLWSDEKAVSMTDRLNEWMNQLEEVSSLELNAPVDTTAFFPVRSAFIKPISMVLMDTFGRSQMLASAFDDVYVAESLRPDARIKGSKNTALLPPRISQNGRIKFHYVRDTQASPMIGFLVPNLLNRGLMIFGPDGEMLGSLQLAYREARKQRVIWRSTPLISPSSFEEVVFPNEMLKNFVSSLRVTSATTDTALNELLHYIDRRQCEILPESITNPQDISVLCGRPIALFQASVTLETMSPLSVMRSFESFGKESTNHFEDVPFSLHIGDTTRQTDGFIGYYERKQTAVDYTHFIACTGASKTDSAFGYIDYQKDLKLDLNENKCKELLCLMEPYASITLTSGICPLDHIHLPEDYYTTAIRQMYMAFEVNPILSRKDSVAIPFDNSISGEWSFAYRTKSSYKECKGIAPCLNTLDEETSYIMDGFLIRRNEEE